MRPELRRVCFCGTGLLALAACASSVESLQSASAISIGNNTRPTNVTVSNVQRGATEVRWTATLPSGATYSCAADDMVRRPYCFRR